MTACHRSDTGWYTGPGFQFSRFRPIHVGSCPDTGSALARTERGVPPRGSPPVSLLLCIRGYRVGIAVEPWIAWTTGRKKPLVESRGELGTSSTRLSTPRGGPEGRLGGVLGRSSGGYPHLHCRPHGGSFSSPPRGRVGTVWRTGRRSRGRTGVDETPRLPIPRLVHGDPACGWGYPHRYPRCGQAFFEQKRPPPRRLRGGGRHRGGS